MKLSRFISFAALASILFVGCGKDDDKTEEVVLPDVTISGSTIENVVLKLSKTSATEVSVVVASDNADFTVKSPVSIAAGKTTAEVAVNVKEGLAAGIYEPTISIKSANGAKVGTAAAAKLSYVVEAQDPGTDPENPGTDPENPGTDPETPGTDPETPGTESGVAGAAIDFANIKTLDLSNKDFACWYFFQKPIELKDGFTVIFNIMLDSAPGQQSAIAYGDGNPDPSYRHSFRFGQPEHTAKELELMICENSDPTGRPKIYFDNIETQTWATMAITADKDGKYTIYTNGEESSTAQGKALADVKPTFQSIEFANSWGKSYRKPFTGNICGFSVWTKTLSAEEVKSLTGKTPNLTAEGLAAYWAFDEGEGTTIKEKTGKYENIDFTKSTHNNNDNDTVNEIFDNTANMKWD